MKTMLRLVLALVVLAGLAVPSVAEYTISSKPIGGAGLNCLQFCMVALCPPGGCGAFVDSQGVTRCGCLGALGVQ